LEDQDYWRLVIASCIVHAYSPAQAYRQLLDRVRGLDPAGLDWMDISLLGSDSPQLSVFRSVAENSRVLAVGPSSWRLEDAYVYRWGATAELECDFSPGRLAQIWENERKLSNLPQLLFSSTGKWVTMRFHPRHGLLPGIENIKRNFQIALHRPGAFPGCKVNWLT
jgi:hypothetical protein